MPASRSSFDVIVVGSGLGGLVTAACLAADGKSVLVLEQHEMLGGVSQVFRRKKSWEFDVGVHYVGGVQRGSDGLIATVLRGLGVEDRVEWSQLDPEGMDDVRFPGRSFRVPTNWDGLAESLAEAFPADADGLRKCIAHLRYIGEGADRVNDVPHSVRVLLPLLRRPREAAAIARGLEEPISRLFDRCGLSEEARAGVLGLIHLHNTPPSKTSPLLIAFLLRHFFKQGAYFPTSGGQVLAANLVEVIQANGGVVRTKARVASIDVEAGRVTGVTLDDGERFRADVVVSNADAHRTFGGLVEARHVPGRTRRRIARFRRPHGIFSIYLAADVDISKTRPASNIILHDRYDLETTYDLLGRGEWDPKAWLGLSSPTLKTKGVRHFGTPGHSSIESFFPVPLDYGFWGLDAAQIDGRGYEDNPDYQERKAEVEELVYARTLAALPELEGHVVWRESSTPVSHERYTLSRMPYGPENAKDQIGPFRRLSVTTPIKGLFLAGASTVYMYGIAFTMRGGYGTASAILGRDLLADAHAGKVLGDVAALPDHGPDWDPFFVCRRHAVKPRRTEPALAASA